METRETIQKELASIAPGIPNLPKQTPYLIPEEYFNGITEVVVSKAKATSSGKVRTLFLRWAVAACAAGLISLVIFKNLQHRQEQIFVKTEAAIISELNNLSQDDLIAYLEIHAQSGDLLTIEKNLENTVLSSTEENDEVLLSELLEDVSEQL